MAFWTLTTALVPPSGAAEDEAPPGWTGASFKLLGKLPSGTPCCQGRSSSWSRKGRCWDPQTAAAGGGGRPGRHSQNRRLWCPPALKRAAAATVAVPSPTDQPSNKQTRHPAACASEGVLPPTKRLERTPRSGHGDHRHVSVAAFQSGAPPHGTGTAQPTPAPTPGAHVSTGASTRLPRDGPGPALVQRLRRAAVGLGQARLSGPASELTETHLPPRGPLPLHLQAAAGVSAAPTGACSAFCAARHPC